MGFVRSLNEKYQRALSELAERWIDSNPASARRERAMRIFLAERLIALAAGATFVVAPVCLVLAGSALPGTYGAATAVALVFVAVPFLALGWLAISRAPWHAALFALAAWAALSGSTVHVSPLLAATCGAVLFSIAFGNHVGRRLKASLAEAAARDVADTGTGHILAPGIARLDIARDGSIRSAAGARADAFGRKRAFIDHVHLADRIAVMSAFAAAGKCGEAAPVTARVDLSRRGQAQAFETVELAITGNGQGLRIAIESAEPNLPAADRDADAAARQRFLATVSHELRTPLNSIIGFADILRRDLFGPLANDRQREYADLIHSSGNHLLSIVNAILDVSKLDAGTYSIHRESFDVNSTVGECVAMMMPQAAQKDIRIESELADEIAEGDGDRRAVRQIVINLLSNAIKFTGQGGCVRVVTALRENGYEIRVSDNGIGMDDRELSRVGTPFMQANNVYTRTCEGTGLGLTVVEGLVGLHGGTVGIQSEPGEGTEVTVFIPDRGIRRGMAAGPAHDGSDENGFRSAMPRQREGKEGADAVRLAG